MDISETETYAVNMKKTVKWRGLMLRAGTRPTLKGVVINELLTNDAGALEVPGSD